MSDKFVFHNAKIKSMETKLLSMSAVQRLVDCQNTTDAFKTLIDMGFGNGVSFDGNDFDALFEGEERKNIDFLREYNVDNALDVFLLQLDYLNLKTILKAQAQGISDVSLQYGGLYDVDTIKLFVALPDGENVPKQISFVVKRVNALIEEGKITPHIIDTFVDKAMYEHIFSVVKKSGNLARTYFVRKIDYLNIGSFLRCKRLSLPLAFFEEGFIVGGEIALCAFQKIYDASPDALKECVKGSVYESVVSKVVDDGNITAFEVARDNALLKMWKDEYNDMFSVAPIVSYYLTKDTEIRVAKLVVAGIKNNVDAAIIKERMRDLYA